ncbi:hypothetical protein Clacol_007217 [Clathrus columnatus]|uniref:Uncharacterized protein n=1 Tax=Clathrus columnatus TaxID=1419009 RepID=A0AAV5AM14_9AGAM|nr:hypothetical protein Clacol_007217 [Clathrus columnatus]
MEKPDGEPVEKIWEKVDRVDLVHKLAKLHRPLINLHFNCYGSLYYKGDVNPPYKSTTDFLEQNSQGVDISPFCMGPISQQNFWEEERALVTERRGPYTSALDYMCDVALREQYWIYRHAKPSLTDDFLCGIPTQGKQDDHIEILERYKSLLQYLVPKERLYLHGHLWHPHLSTSNLFVVPSKVTQDGKIQVNITSCINWQGAWVGPAFLQLTVPTLFRIPCAQEALTLPTHFETLDADTCREAKLLYEEAVLHNLFETTALHNIVQLPSLAELRELEYLAQLTWKTGLLPFRETLINVWKQWAENKCPIDFTPVECREHDAAYTSWVENQERASVLSQEFSVGPSGYIAGDQAHFDNVKMRLEKRRREWEAGAKNPEHKRVLELLWPYRDTLSDNPRTHLEVNPEVLRSLHSAAEENESIAKEPQASETAVH